MPLLFEIVVDILQYTILYSMGMPLDHIPARLDCGAIIGCNNIALLYYYMIGYYYFVVVCGEKHQCF